MAALVQGCEVWPIGGCCVHIVLLHFYKSPNPVYGQIAARLRASGHRVWLGYINQKGSLEWHDGERPIDEEDGTIQLPDNPFASRIPSLIWEWIVFVGVMLRIRRFLRKHRPDIVQLYPVCSHGSWLLPLFMPENMRFILDFRQLGMHRVSGSAISRFHRLRDWLSNKERQLMGKFFFDRIFFCDVRAARVCLGEKWTRWATAIPVGVGSHFLTFKHSEPDPLSSKESVQFVYLGVIGRFRQLERLFFAVQNAARETNRFNVTLIGPDVSDGYYHQLVEELGLQDTITIRPPIPYEKVPAEIARYDVALAYIPDNIPDWRYQPTLKALEYRALGMPTIAPDNPPNRELVEEGVNGLVVQNTPEDWARAILALIEDRGLIQRFRTNAHRMRTGRLWDSISTMYEAAYEQLLSGGLPASL